MTAPTLGLNEYPGDFRVDRFDVRFHIRNSGLHLTCRNTVNEIDAEAEQDVAWSEMHGQQFVDADDAFVAIDDLADIADYMRTRCLADEQTLTLIGKHPCGTGEYDADDDGGDGVENRVAGDLGQADTDQRRAETQHRCAVLEQDSEHSGVLAALYRLEVAQRPLGLAKFAQGHPPGRSLEQYGEAQYGVVHQGFLERVRMLQFAGAFIDGQARSQGEDQDGHHEGPEIEFHAVTERVARVRRLAGALHAVQHEALVAGIHHRMDGLAEHGGTAGDACGDELGNCDQAVAGQGSKDDFAGPVD